MKIFSLDEGLDPTQSKRRYCEIADGVVHVNAIRCNPPPHGCGEIWYIGGRIYKEVPQGRELRRRPRGPVSPEQFQELATDIRRAIDLSVDAPIVSGMDIGSFHLSIQHANLVDLSSPIIGALIASDKFVDFLQQGGFTGWRSEPVVVTARRPSLPEPRLHELVAVGSGGNAMTFPVKRLLDWKSTRLNSSHSS